MSSLVEGCHWLGRLLLDLIIIRVWSPIYRSAQGLCRRTLGVFKIAKVIRKPKGSSVTREQLTPYPGQKDEDFLSTEVQKKCQGELNPPKLLLPIDPIP